ncbi:hypothetical protein AVT69_gp262 [Pseudomonas phage PhiPA3]|uniref:Uncharacterized protein 264 n=1 Tax=Pseudomonas phage PhiPA3 TaxID=998086 RepID=F8SJA3_BPPA3|nr:hypothetical protein AVT69_gp262 [Pseudomonas phage PhiPA3]AEH03687.1 hypothetical protein [Pseudomonas phage PhiPA3]
MSTRLHTTIFNLPYHYKGKYSERFKEMREVGVEALEFTDMDIEGIINGDTQRDHDELKFYKETWLEKPRHICFTIFEKRRNRIVVELHVELDKKRVYWVKPRMRWGLPNMIVKLKVIQDLSKQQWIGSMQV